MDVKENKFRLQKFFNLEHSRVGFKPQKCYSPKNMMKIYCEQFLIMQATGKNESS